ncbi:MAG: ABC transporter substrate binding protein [Pseudomonadota bacterium]
MPGIHSTGRIAATLTALAVLCSGCATPAAQAPVQDAPAPETVVVVPDEPIAVLPEPSPDETALPEPAEPDEPVTIIVSGRHPAYADVAEALLLRYEDASVHDLSGNPASPVSILRQINDAGTSAVVAIGLKAARTAVAMSDAPVVFGQVFNYQAYPLLGEDSRAVAAYAPLERQLDEWLAHDPGIRRIGLIIGEGHEALVSEAREAAAAHGVELRVTVSASDQETLYAFRRMSRDIDGFWLFPDNRILSGRTLREMSEIAARQQVRIAAQNEGMLTLGATLSLSSVASDIASVIADIVERIQEGDIASVPALSALREVRITAASPGLVRAQ